jgi:hypothetical protein
MRKTKKGGNKAERQKNRSLGRSKKMKGRTRRQPRIYGGVWPFSSSVAEVAPAPTAKTNELDKNVSAVPRIQPEIIEPEFGFVDKPKFVFVHTPAFPETPAQIAFNKAVAANDFKTIEILFIRGDIDVNVAPNGQFTALYHAITEGRDDIASVLLKAGAIIVKGNHFEYNSQRYPLLTFLLMLHHKYKEVTLELINLVIDKISEQTDRDEILDERSTTDQTALTYAITADLKEIVDKLIPISTVAGLNRALLHAAATGKTDYIIALFEAETGADVNAKDENGKTALDMANESFAYRNPKITETVELLQAEMKKRATAANAEPTDGEEQLASTETPPPAP